MRITELQKEHGLPEEVCEILHSEGIEELYPPQSEAVKKGVLKGGNLVLAIPTAAGKTLVSELCMLNSIIKDGGKCLYTVPLRALASEKFEEFKEKYEQLGISVGIATGDFDVPSSELADYDILVATSEKVDSLLRHKADWLADLTTVAVFDEIHLLDDAGRGPTLEILVARLRQINPDLQVLGLSATISNSEEIAEWLDADHIRSEWRPVPLKEGVYHGGKIIFEDLTEREVEASAKHGATKLALDNLKNGGGQVLIFVSTRKSTEVAARRASKKIKEILTNEEKEDLKEVAEEIEVALGEPTKTCEKLAKYVRGGVAFHHAGLHHKQRTAIEDAFRDKLIKVICATPTLAAGVNLPSQRVIIRDYKRYSPPYGMQPIPVLEYKQQAGRAGRPGYDEYGEAVLISNSESETEQLIDGYIRAEPERIKSKLASEPAIRSHVLGSIAAGYVNSLDSMLDFIGQTFFAYQFSTDRVTSTVEKVLDFLKEEEMVSDRGRWLSATNFGKRVSWLYIDPLSGVEIRKGLMEAESGKKLSEIGLLHMICSTPDMGTFYLRKGDKTELDLFVSDFNSADKLLIEPPEKWKSPEKYEYYLAEVKTAKMLQDWANEIPEDRIHEEYGIGAGDIRRKVSTAEWLLNAGYEIAKLFKIERCISPLDDLEKRVRYGIKEELLGLVSLRGLGRVRARNLFDAGYKTVEDIRGADIRELTRISHIGKEVAKSIKKQAR